MSSRDEKSFLQRFATLCDAELFKRRDIVDDELNHLKAEFYGRLDSGAYYKSISRMLSTELQTRATMIWRNLVQAHESLRAELTGTLRDDMQRAWEAQLSTSYDELQSLLDTQIKSPSDRPYFSLDETLKNTLRKYFVEIDMYVDTLARKEPRESETKLPAPVEPLHDVAQPLKSKTTGARADNQNRFALMGDYWSVTFNGKTKALKNTKGMRYIEHLLRNQGKEVYVLDLFYAINPPDQKTINKDLSTLSAEQLEEAGLSVSGLGDAGEAITPEGQKRIKAHLKELQDHIDDAIETGDEDKQVKLEEEQENILRHYKADLSLGGRPRKASSPIDQIRKNVTRCTRKDIRNIESKFPELGHHLHYCIKTGIFCRYAPHPEVKWHFDLP
jgi:hypothetical protein